jgi:hypothetical protein
MKMFPKILCGLAALSLGLAGIGVATVASGKPAAEANATDTTVRTLSFNFYDSTKLTTTTGTTATLAIVRAAMSVPSGAVVADVLTESTFTNVYNGKSGGLSFGTSSKTGSWVLTVASGYEIVHAEIVGTAYDTGSTFTANTDAGTGSLGAKAAEIADISTKLVWDFATGTTSLTLATTAKRATIYTLTLGYGTVSSIAVTGTPSKTSYYAGDTFDPTGLTVTATYNVGATADVTSLVTWTPDPLTAGTTAMTASYQYGATVTALYSGITVAARTVTSIAVTTQPTVVAYSVGDALSFTGLVITATYNVGSTTDSTSDCTYSPAAGHVFAASEVGTVTVTATLSGASTTFNVSVAASTIGYIQNHRTQYSGVSKTVSGTVTGIIPDSTSGKYNIFVQDGDYACEVYQLASIPTGVVVGAKVSVTGTVAVFNGLLEITSATVTYVSAGDSITPLTLTSANYSATGLALMDSRLVTAELLYVSGSLYASSKAASVSVTVDGTAATFRCANANVAAACGADFDLFFACVGTTTSFTWTGNLGWYSAPQLSPTSLNEITCASVFDGLNAVVTALDMSSTTAEQCKTKFAAAKTAYSALSTAQKALFNGASIYTAASARYAAWAAANGESVSASNVSEMNNSTSVIAIAVVSVLGLLTLAGVVVLKKKHN